MQNINSVWAYLIVEECLRHGISFFCISPGSRSTYLTSAVARHKKAETRVFVDERSAGFYALGYAKATGKPAPLICTSGTALANYFPAVVEAGMSGIPMLILSADRPPELRHTGANQTIHQPGMFGSYTKWQFDMPCPTRDIPPEMVLTTVDQAIYQATASPSGPVHLNCMFREPLTPEPVNAGELKQESLKPWLSDQKPYTIYTAPEALATNPQTTSGSPFLNELQEAFKKARQPFITIGTLNSQNDIELVSGLCKVLNVPFYADISSGLRLSSFKNHLAHLDLLLLSDVFSGRFRPDVYLHIGGPMVSRRIQQHVAKIRDCKKFLVKDHPYRYDAFHQFSRSIQWSNQPFCEMFTEKINPGIVDSPKWLAELSEMVSFMLKESFSDHSPVDERSLPYLVSGHQTPGQALFLSNSMPIRDMDMFGVSRENRVQTATNRGASGIDGIISSAIGFMHGVKKPTTLVIGDLSFMHDMNAIYHLRNSDLPLTLIVINNGGGGIFSFLPISTEKDIFNEYFETPHEQDFQSIAGLAGLEYACPKSNASFVKVYNQAQHASKSTLIEIRTQTTANFNAHKELYTKVIEQLQEYDYPD